MRTNLRKQSTKKFINQSSRKENIADLYNSCTGYNNLTIQEILEYLYGNYGDLDKADFEQVELEMSSPFDLNDPFRIFISKIEDCVNLAKAAGALYTNA